MTNKAVLDFEESSGNVFADIGIPNAEEYLAKAKLAHQINHIIEARHLTQIEAAKLLGIDQPKISALACGRLSGFSIERLFKFLRILNQDIVIMVKPHNEKLKINAPHIFVRYSEVYQQ
jgi:predicted XRE-type DNA-binding protein